MARCCEAKSTSYILPSTVEDGSKASTKCLTWLLPLEVIEYVFLISTLNA
jgi:hypothetical protein